MHLFGFTVHLAVVLFIQFYSRCCPTCPQQLRVSFIWPTTDLQQSPNKLVIESLLQQQHVWTSWLRPWRWMNWPFHQRWCWDTGVSLERAAGEETQTDPAPPLPHTQHTGHKCLCTAPGKCWGLLSEDFIQKYVGWAPDIMMETFLFHTFNELRPEKCGFNLHWLEQTLKSLIAILNVEQCSQTDDQTLGDRNKWDMDIIRYILISDRHGAPWFRTGVG